MPSGKYQTWSPTITPKPTKSLPARPPAWNSPSSIYKYRPTTYQQIHTRKDFNTYVYIWLKINTEGEYASDTENELYDALLRMYG